MRNSVLDPKYGSSGLVASYTRRNREFDLVAMAAPQAFEAIHVESEGEAKNSPNTSRGWMKKAALALALGLGVLGFMAMPKLGGVFSFIGAGTLSFWEAL